MTVWLELITQDKDDKRDEEEATAFDWLLCFIVNNIMFYMFHSCML